MATKVSLIEVVDALEIASDEMSSFVSKKTGQVLLLSHEAMHLAEEDSKEDLPAWQEEELRLARDVLESTDWLELPSKFEIHEWEIMNRFGQSLSVPAQSEEVLDAIHGSGAFRVFKSTIRRLRLEDVWFAFRSSAFEDIAKSWLSEHGFEINDVGRRGGRPTTWRYTCQSAADGRSQLIGNPLGRRQSSGPVRDL
jgi:hypothetical protein